MSVVGANQIRFRSGIAAVNDNNRLRVYSQDTNGAIGESQYEGQWTGGTDQNVIAQAVLGSPLVATSQALNRIRVYYIGQGNTVKEACYDSGRGWYDGALSGKNFKVAPYSMLAACFLTGTTQLRVYAQKPDNSVQEYGYDSDQSGWQEMTNLGQALPGTGLACTAFDAPTLRIRVYLQNQDLSLAEKCYDSGTGWYAGKFSVATAYPRTDMAATNFGRGQLRVYFVDKNNILKEKAWDSNTWYDGGFSNACIPGSQVSAVNWGQGDALNVRVYFQNGTQVTAVSEWMWAGSSWGMGRAALPPAQ